MPDFLLRLKQHFPQDTWPWLLSALRQEMNYWSALQGEFGLHAIEKCQGAAKDFTPARVCLLALGYPEELATLRSPELPPATQVEPPEQAARQDLPAPAPLLAKAGYLALQLREQHRASDSWQHLQENRQAIRPLTLACLYGMLPRPVEMLAAASTAFPAAVIAKAILAQPLPPAQQAEQFQAYLDLLGSAERLPIARQIFMRLPGLIGRQAAALMAERQPLAARGHPHLDAWQPEIANQLELADLHNFAGDQRQAVGAVSEAIKLTRRMQARLAARMACTAQSQAEMQTRLNAWELATHLDPLAPAYLGGLVSTHLAAGQIDEARQRLTEGMPGLPEASENDPTLCIARARLAMRTGELTPARRLASAALAATQEAPSPAAEDEITILEQQELPGLLLDLGLPEEAIQAAQLAMQSQPVNIHLVVILGRAYQASGQFSAAQATFQLATGLDPQERDLQRQLASALEADQEWEPALQIRESLVADAIRPSLADLHALASCALQAQQPERAVEVCQATLELDRDHGLTHALKGEATAGRGETLAALEYLKTVTQNSPELPQPWLSLAKIYQQAGQSSKGLEMLRAAATTLPDHAGILLALGEACLQNNAPTEALPVLQQAAQLSTGSALLTPQDIPWRVGLYLGKTLQQLGHLQQAREQLASTWATAPYDPEAAFAYATCLLSLREHAAALEPLSTYLEREPAEIEPYLQYSRAVLALVPQADRDRLGQASVFLRQAREIDPHNPESAALLAEVLSHNNDLPAALEMYRLALDSSLAQEPEWRIRLNHGFGLTALQMGQIEAALAALQEAAQVDPHNPRMQRALCEAYEAAGLDEEAMAAARQALQLAPSDLDNLLWFANQMQSAGRRPGIDPEGARQEATQALQQASELAPENADILIHLSQLQIASDDFPAARQTLLTLLNGDQGVQASANQLQHVAANFLQLGNAAEAVRCLEGAWQLVLEREDPDSARRFELITELAAARQQTGDSSGALAAIEQALELAPRETNLYLHKANLLISLANNQNAGSELVLEKTQLALQALEKAVEIDPQNPTTHLQAARLQRALGDLPTALAHAERAARLFQGRVTPPSRPTSSALNSDQHTFSIRTSHQIAAPGNPPAGEHLPAEVSARLLAADLACTMLEYEQAQEILRARLPLDDGDLNEHCVYFCMRAELSIAAGDFHQAIEQFINALELAPEHPRVLVLQARLMARQLISLDSLPGTALAAGPRQLLQLVRQGLSIADPTTPGQATWLENDLPPTSTWLAIFEASLELRQWELALELSRASMADALPEPRAPLAVAQALIMRAEFQRYAQAMGLQQSAPGEAALFAENAEACQEALEWAEQSLLQPHQPAATAQGRLPASLEHIRRWQLRSQAIFEPSAENAQALAEKATGPEDTWALLLCLEQIGDLSTAGRAAQSYPRLPFILAYLAHLLSESKPRQALAAIQAAYEILLSADPEALAPGEPTVGDIPRCLHATDIAIMHAQLGRLLHQHGQQGTDLADAYRHLNLALEDAPQEPRWQLWAAEIALQLAETEGEPSLQAAAHHLEQAIEGDPTQPAPFHILGELYLQLGELELAAGCLEQACELDPEDASGWLMLARIYQQIGATSQAAARAERAVTLAPNQVEPLLLRGQIALVEDNPKGAQNRAQAALRLEPNHPEALCLLARALQAQGHTQEALESLERALPASSNPLPLHLERIHLMRQTSGAAAALHAVQELGLAYPDALARLALEISLLEETGHPQAAIQTAQMALRGQAEGEDLPAELAVDLHFRLGRLLGAAGQLDQSLHHLNQALQINPNHVEALLETGRVHQQRRQHALAIKAYHKAIAAAPNDHRAYYQAGLALKESKDYLEAEKMLRRAGELAPEDVGIHRLLGAVVALNLVHNREPTHPEISSLFDRR